MTSNLSLLLTIIILSSCTPKKCEIDPKLEVDHYKTCVAITTNKDRHSRCIAIAQKAATVCK